MIFKPLSSPWALTSEFSHPQVKNNNMAVVDFQRHYFSHKSAKGLRKPPCRPFGSFAYLELAEREVCQQLVQVLLQISWKVSRSKAFDSIFVSFSFKNNKFQRHNDLKARIGWDSFGFQPGLRKRRQSTDNSSLASARRGCLRNWSH